MTHFAGFSYRRKFEELSRNSFCHFGGIAEVEFVSGITTGRKIRRRSLRLRSGKISSPENLVRKEGFEPPRPFGHKILSLARLPVPPLPQWWLYSTSMGSAPPLGIWEVF